MRPLHIITPVKDSILLTLESAEAVLHSQIEVPYHYTIYNDFSTPSNRTLLEQFVRDRSEAISLVNLSDITTHPSPNYRLMLQLSQQRAIAEGTDLMIIESDVVVRQHTIQALIDGAVERCDCGIAAAVTVDERGRINYPYEYARGHEGECYAVKRHCSFCCSLLTLELLQALDLRLLNPEKHWFDVVISHQSLELGFKNYLFTYLPVTHHPHASRPWKQLKYSNPIKYYWIKLTQGFDKI